MNDVGVLALLGEEPLRKALIVNVDSINNVISDRPTVLDFYSQKPGLEGKIQYHLRICFLKKAFENEIDIIVDTVKASLEIARTIVNSSLFPDEIRDVTMRLCETYGKREEFTRFTHSIYEYKGKYSTIGYKDVDKHVDVDLAVSYRKNLVLSKLEWKFPVNLSKNRYVEQTIPVKVFQRGIPTISNLHRLVVTTNAEDVFEAHVLVEGIAERGLIGWKEKQFRIEVSTKSTDTDHAIGASLRVLRSVFQRVSEVEPLPIPVLFDIDDLLKEWYLYLVAGLRTHGYRYARMYNHCLLRRTAELSLSHDNGYVKLVLKYSFNKKEYKKYRKVVFTCLLGSAIEISFT